MSWLLKLEAWNFEDMSVWVCRGMLRNWWIWGFYEGTAVIYVNREGCAWQMEWVVRLGRIFPTVQKFWCYTMSFQFPAGLHCDPVQMAEYILTTNLINVSLLWCQYHLSLSLRWGFAYHRNETMQVVWRRRRRRRRRRRWRWWRWRRRNIMSFKSF